MLACHGCLPCGNMEMRYRGGLAGEANALADRTAAVAAKLATPPTVPRVYETLYNMGAAGGGGLTTAQQAAAVNAAKTKARLQANKRANFFWVSARPSERGWGGALLASSL